MFMIIKSRYCFVLGDVAKKTFENISKKFNKARNKMIKAKKSGTSTQEAIEAVGDVDGYEYLMWLVPFIAVRKTKCNITSSTENQSLSKARDLEDELENDEDEGNAEELNLPKSDLEISSELDETRTSPETSSKNSQVTGRPKENRKKGKQKEPETTAKQLEKKKLEFMSDITEMVGQTNATDPDTAFAKLVLSHVRQLPKRLTFSCQNEINQVLFRYMIYSESNSSEPFGIPPDHFLSASSDICCSLARFFLVTRKFYHPLPQPPFLYYFKTL